MAPISDKWKWKYFWRNGWTGQISLMRLTKIAFGRAGFSRTKGGTESIDDRKSIKTDLPDRQRGLVMPGPDPAIHPNRKLLVFDGCPGLRLAEGASASQTRSSPGTTR
jgi:hypothetical protein